VATAQRALRGGHSVCYSAPPVLQRTKMRQDQVVESETTVRQNRRGVDELSETLHNLIPLLLTNKTIRGTQQGSTEYDL
jgi:hypothetical protein